MKESTKALLNKEFEEANEKVRQTGNDEDFLIFCPDSACNKCVREPKCLATARYYGQIYCCKFFEEVER